jgi:hypothetical protein
MGLKSFGRSRVLWLVGGITFTTVIVGIAFGTASGTVTSGTRTTYVPITPCRLVDTRPAPLTVGPRSSPLGAADTYTVDAFPPAGGCPIPTSVTALQLNVTAVGPTANTFITVWPNGPVRPTASNLNPSVGQSAVPNAVTTGVSGQGRFNIFNNLGTVNVVIDIVGYYDNHNFDDRYYTKAAADAATATAIQNASPEVVFNVGTARSIPQFDCIDVFAFGVGSAGDAGKVVTGYITDSGGVNPPPSINNQTVFLPGTVFKTSQGGTIGFVQLCNPTTSDKALPAGWTLIASVKS